LPAPQFASSDFAGSAICLERFCR
jgi:hypothetical protein